MNTYRCFKEAYAHWWHVSPSTLYRVVRWSNTLGSAWLEINGEVICVPRICLVDSFTDRYGEGWRRTMARKGTHALGSACL